MANNGVELGIEVFLDAFSYHFVLETREFGLLSTLQDDLGFDSIEMYEAVLFAEEFVGTPPTLRIAPTVTTVGDVYEYAVALVSEPS